MAGSASRFAATDHRGAAWRERDGSTDTGARPGGDDVPERAADAMCASPQGALEDGANLPDAALAALQLRESAAPRRDWLRHETQALVLLRLAARRAPAGSSAFWDTVRACTRRADRRIRRGDAMTSGVGARGSCPPSIGTSVMGRGGYRTSSGDVPPKSSAPRPTRHGVATIARPFEDDPDRQGRDQRDLRLVAG